MWDVEYVLFSSRANLLLILYSMQVAYSFKTDSILDKDRVKGPNLMNK